VSDADAFDMARASATQEGILVGISSGATLAAVKQKEAEFAPNSRVLIFSYDTGERYLSIDDFL
jgi:cysteine synthase A